MAKIYNFCFIIAGMLLLMAFAGFPTITGNLLSNIGLTSTTNGAGQISDINIALSWTAIGIIFLATTAFALSSFGFQINSGIFSMQTTDSKIVAPIALLLIGWGLGDMISILNLAGDMGYSWIKFVTALIIVPMMFAWVIGMVQWWRGADI